MNYAIFRELCDQMRFEVDCAKLHHRVIPEGLTKVAWAEPRTLENLVTHWSKKIGCHVTYMYVRP